MILRGLRDARARQDEVPRKTKRARRGSIHHRRSRQIRRRDHPRRGGPGDSDRRIVVAQPARVASRVDAVDLVEHVGRIFERQEAVRAAGRDQQRFAVLGAERRGDPAPVGLAVAPEIDDDVEGPAASDAHQLGLGVRRRLEVQAAQSEGRVVARQAGLQRREREAGGGEFLRRLRGGYGGYGEVTRLRRHFTKSPITSEVTATLYQIPNYVGPRRPVAVRRLRRSYAPLRPLRGASGGPARHGAIKSRC